MHFRFEQLENGEDRLPVRVVEKTHEPQHGDDPPFVGSSGFQFPVSGF
jgi:hypothetical protein